jgi:hypothetical protein
MADASGLISHEVILALLIAALGIFAIVAARSRNVRSFQFQIAIFIIVWIAGEMADVLQEMGVLNILDDQFGMEIHLASMAFFSIMIWLRFFYSRARGRKIVDSPPPDFYH